MDLRSEMARIPLLPVTLAFIAGVTGGIFLHSPAFCGIILLAATLLAIFKQFTLAAMTTVVFIGYCDISFRYDNSVIDGLNGKNAIYSGRILEKKESNSSQTLLVGINRYGKNPDKLNKIPETKAMVSVLGFEHEYDDGKIFTFSGTLHKPAAIKDLPDEIDYADILSRKNIELQAVIPTDSVLNCYDDNSFWSYCTNARNKITEIIYRSGLSPKTKEFLNAALTGDDSDIRFDERQTFTATGISHILALSGLHAGIIALVISIALWPLYLTRARNICNVIIITGLWIFAAVTGFSPSVTRAVIMATLVIIGRMIQRYNSAANSLCFAALIILLFDPASIMSIGFQLSFAAVLSIIVFARTLNPISERNRITYNICSYFTVSIAAMIGTGLLSIIYFHNFPVYFLFANIIVSIFLPFLLGCGILMILLNFMGITPEWMYSIIDMLYLCISEPAAWIANLPGASADNVYIPVWYLVPFLASIITLRIWIETKSRLWGTALIGMITITIILIITTPHTERDNTIYAIRDTYHTALAEIDNKTNTMHIISTAPQEELYIRNRAEFRYSDFIGNRDIDSIRIEFPSTGITDTTITRFNRKITLLWGDSGNLPISTNYLIICRGTKDGIETIINNCAADTIILSYDLNKRRAKRYAAECAELRQPYHTLSSSGWSLSERNCK